MSLQRRRSTKSSSQGIDFPVSPAPEGTHPSEVVFPEWSDDEIVDRFGVKDKHSKQKVSGEDLYVDPHTIVLPSEIGEAVWKRPSEIFNDYEIVIFKENYGYSDFIAGSAHLIHSEFVRNFISTICELEYLSKYKPWFFEGDPYTFLNDSNHWMPWYHIYSAAPDNNKGIEKTKGYVKPTVNKIGKYAVRLFWMGSWRRVYVDDKIPVNKQNVPVLPCSQIDIGQFDQVTKEAESKDFNNKKKQSKFTAELSKEQPPDPVGKVELWPFLMIKAIIKISMLSRIGHNHLVDFSMVQLLTGWVTIKIEVNDFLDMDTLWNVFAEYIDNYQCPEIDEEKLRRIESLEEVILESSKKGKKGKASKEPQKRNESKDSEPQNFKYSFVCARVSDLRLNNHPDLVGFTPCWGHAFLIDQTRNTPLTKTKKTEPLPQWKKYRWEKWATEEGIYTPPSVVDQHRKYLHVVSPFKQQTSYKQYSNSDAALGSRSRLISDPLLERFLGSGIIRQKEKSFMEERQSSHSIGTKSYSPTWVPFDKLSPYITNFMIFSKTSEIKYHVKVSDLQQHEEKKPPAGKKRGKQKPNKYQFVQWTKEMSESRNVPLYLFTDSLAIKTIVVSFSHVGNTEVLCDNNYIINNNNNNNSNNIHNNNNNSPLQSNNSFNKNVSNSNDTTASRNNASSTSALGIFHSLKHTQSPLPSTMQNIDLDSTTSELEFCGRLSNLLIKYVDVCHDGKLLTNISTFGSKSKMLHLEPGRHFLEIWINSGTSYVLNISSDTALAVGCLEEILEYIQEESEMLSTQINGICNSLGDAISNFGKRHFLSELRSFYSSYKPKTSLKKYESNVLHNAFFEEFLNVIFHNVADADEKEKFAAALSVFFVDPHIPRRKKSVTSDEFSVMDITNLPEEYRSIYLEMLRLALLLQKNYKRYKVKALKATHGVHHKNHSLVSHTLTALYKKFFSAPNRIEYCSSLMRKLLCREDMESIGKKYDFLQDLETVMDVRHVYGIAQVFSDKWVPLTRCVFYCYKSPVTIRIQLFCELKHFFVRVFDNDTNEEIQRLVNNVSRYAYAQNRYGYTVFAYGWAGTQKQVPWKLSFITKQNDKEEFRVVQDILKSEVFRGFYFPNVEDTVCLYQIKVFQNTRVSMRVTTSFEHAQIHVTIKNAQDEIVYEITGKENVIIPVTVLSANHSYQEVSPSSSKVTMGDPHVFFLKVQVLKGTWPLQMQEWKTIRKELLKKYLFPKIWNGEVGSNMKEKPPSNEQPLPNPNYSLQILYRAIDVISVEKNTQNEDELKEYKTKIFKDNSRFYKGKEIRDEFILKNFPTEEEAEIFEKKSSTSSPVENSIELFTIMYNSATVFQNEFYLDRRINNPFSYKHLIRDNFWNDIPRNKIVIIENEDDEVILKTQEQKNADEEKRLEDVKSMEEDLKALEDNLKNKLSQHLERYSLLEFWLTKVIEEHEQNLSRAYEAKDTYVQYLLENEDNSNASKENSNKLKKDRKK